MPAAVSGPRVVVIGAGFGGLGVAHALRERGVHDITILERADSVGGVWRENTYPGAACDVPSVLYSWSWALNPAWGRRWAQQPEILDYIARSAAEHGLLDLVRFGQEVTSARYDDQAGSWTVETAAGTSYTAEIVVSAVGQLSRPVLPRIEGIESFDGPAFHTAQWRHDVPLEGKRVSVVGTGASAVQVVPAIVDRVGSLTVFQRSAPYVIPKPDTPYQPRHQRTFERFPALVRGERRAWFAATELFNTALEGESVIGRPVLPAMKASWRWQLERQVRDPELRARLVPDYDFGCKRVLLSGTWYPALDRDHVDVVTEEIAEVVPEGIRTTDGRVHAADVLVWGTGFAATDFLAGIEVTGRDGLSLHEAWSEGARAHLGIAVPGFPNLFCVYGPNTNLGGSSIIGMLEAQAGWIAQVASGLADRDGAVEVRREVADAYDREMQSRLGDSVWAQCDSWYRHGARITTNWPGVVAEYRDRLAAVDWSEFA